MPKLTLGTKLLVNFKLWFRNKENRGSGGSKAMTMTSLKLSNQLLYKHQKGRVQEKVSSLQHTRTVTKSLTIHAN